VGVRSDISENGVHAEELDTGADPRVVFVSHGVKERHAGALLQDAVVGGGEEAIREAISGEEKGKRRRLLFAASRRWRRKMRGKTAFNTLGCPSICSKAFLVA